MAIGRPRRFDRDAAIDVAVEIFWRKGYGNTSVAMLCQAMGIFPPSFYAAFKSKAALYAEVIARYNAQWIPTIYAAMEDAATAREGVEAVLLNTAASYTNAAYPPGCLVILSTASEDGDDGELEALVTASRGEIFNRFLSRLTRGVEDGEISVAADIVGVARLFSTILHGIALQSCDGVPRAALETMVRTVMLTWPTLTSPPASD